MKDLGLATGRRVLDVCTGTGALALAAAGQGARSVTAVDLSWRSVLTARVNAGLAGLPVDVRRGDLFAPVAGERFDLVVANPPYVPARSARLPRHGVARCWDAGPDGRALVDRICVGAADVLAPGGVLLLTHSAVTDTERTLRQLSGQGFDASVVATGTVPFGPVMTERATWLAERGLIEPEQQLEELVVVAAARSGEADATGTSTTELDVAAEVAEPDLLAG